MYRFRCDWQRSLFCYVEDQLMVKLLKDVLVKLVLSRLITGASCFETYNNSLFSVIFTDTDACYVLCFFLLLAL